MAEVLPGWASEIPVRVAGLAAVDPLSTPTPQARKPEPSSVTVATTVTTTAPAKGEPAKRKRCLTHPAFENWTETPHPTRPGWLRTTCDVCGTWIGDRPEVGSASGGRNRR
jgi:hypothetical protein